MTKKEFKKRIEKKQWWDTEYEDEWWRSDGASSFYEIGLRLVNKGFNYEEALDILGDCHSTVGEEYGN
jgi:hypothetical protein